MSRNGAPLRGNAGDAQDPPTRAEHDVLDATPLAGLGPASGLGYHPRTPRSASSLVVCTEETVPSAPAARTPSPPRQRERVKSTPTARRVRSRQLLLVDSPAGSLFRERTSEWGDAGDLDSPLGFVRSLDSPGRRDGQRTPGSGTTMAAVGGGRVAGRPGWSAYKVMPEEYYGRVANRGDDADDAGQLEQAELCGDALKGLRYMEEGLKSLQALQDPARTHALAFADLDKLHDESVQERNRGRRAVADVLASKALGYLTWLDMFETEVYDRLLSVNGATAPRRALSALPPGSAYDDSLSFFALVSDLTYAREILRRECVALVFLPGVWDLRAELDRKRVATRSGIGELQRAVAECVRRGLSLLSGERAPKKASGGDGLVSDHESTHTAAKLAEAVKAVQTIAIPAIAADIIVAVGTLQDAHTASIRLARAEEVSNFFPAGSASAQHTPAESQILQPFLDDLDQLDVVLQWLHAADRGCQQAADRLRGIEQSHLADEDLSHDIDHLASALGKAEEDLRKVSDLAARHDALHASQSFDRVILVDPPSIVAIAPWLASDVRDLAASHARILTDLDERSISFARKAPRHTATLAWLRDVVAKRQEVEDHDSTLREVAETLSKDASLTAGDIEALQALVHIPVKELPVQELELKQLRRQDPRTSLIIERNADGDRQLIRAVDERLNSVLRLLTSSRAALALRAADAEDESAFERVSQAIEANWQEARDSEESLLTLLDIVKWHPECEGSPSTADVKKDVQALQVRWEAQVDQAVRSLRQRYSERPQRLARLDNESQRLHLALLRMQQLANAVDETRYQREYVIEMFAGAAAVEASMHDDAIEDIAHVEKRVADLEREVARTPMVARTATSRTIRAKTHPGPWDDREHLGRRAAELATLTPPSSPRPRDGAGLEPGESTSPTSEGDPRIRTALEGLSLLDTQVRGALNELSARLQSDLALLHSDRAAAFAAMRQESKSDQITRSSSVQSQMTHSSSVDSVAVVARKPSISQSSSRHSLYDETASSRARRISIVADRAEKQAARPRSRVISEAGAASQHGHRRRPSSMLSTSSSMQSLRSAASAHTADGPETAPSLPLPNVGTSKRHSLAHPRRSINRSDSYSHLKHAAAAPPPDVKAHPHLDAAIRKTAKVYKQDHLDIVPASPARTDKDCIEGAYTFRYADKSATRFCRIMIESDKVWVRVGGGFESLDEFLNRTFSAFIHQSLADPVSSDTSHATLMGFESPEAMSRVLHAQTSPEQNTPTRRGSASPVRHWDGTPLAHKAHVKFTSAKHTSGTTTTLVDQESPLRQRSGSASPITMRSHTGGSPAINRRFSVTSASPSLRRGGSG